MLDISVFTFTEATNTYMLSVSLEKHHGLVKLSEHYQCTNQFSSFDMFVQTIKEIGIL